jgi:hypothetical protein
MTRIRKTTTQLLSLFVLLVVAHSAFATPSTTFWTPMTLDIQSYGIVHLGIDNYFRVNRPLTGTDSAFFTDFTAPTVGVLPFKKIQMEMGVDYFANSAHPWFGNAKLGSPEGSFFKNQPAIEVGIYDVGGKFGARPGDPNGRLDFDVLYGVIGKSFPVIGRISVGPYFGNHATLVNSGGKAENLGFMAAFDHSFFPVKDKDGAVQYSKVVYAVDYQSGKNALGAYGTGLYYFFTPDISLLVGPTFFNDRLLNGGWRMSTQLDINLPSIGKLFKKRAQ